MNDSPARTDPQEAAIGRPTQTARRLVEASVSPEHPAGLRRRAPSAGRLDRHRQDLLREDVVLETETQAAGCLYTSSVDGDAAPILRVQVDRAAAESDHAADPDPIGEVEGDVGAGV